MGSFINRLLKDEPAFSAEFNNYIQEIKLENNEEIINLHSTINSLRQQLEENKFQTNKSIQKAVLQKTEEIKQLQLTISEQRSFAKQIKI